MKSLLKNLLFDKTIVEKIKQSNLNKEVLYNHLFNGKITLQEYLSASSKMN